MTTHEPIDVRAELERVLARYVRLSREREKNDVLLEGEGLFAIALAITQLANVIERGQE